jgi:pyruvate dehydrogenase E1 component alpha subunit
MTDAAPASEDGLALYRTMVLIRLAEERLSGLFAAGEIPGFIHLSIGQEAVAAGMMSALSAGDSIASNHRGHGHALAKGIPLESFFLEVFGKAEGICGGRGGSMHVADLSVGMLGANGIVGAGIPIALGSALAHKVRRTGHLAAVFFGDGAMAEGVLHECLNMARLWSLPFLAVLENNGWAEFSEGASQFTGDIHAIAGAFGIPSRRVDGNDVAAVAAAAREVVAAMRAGGGPHLIECVTTRVHGHFEGDAQAYRPQEEIAALAARDPLRMARERLLAGGVAEAALERIVAETSARIDAAVARARAAPEPSPEGALADVHTPRRA